MNATFQFFLPTKIIFGKGSIDYLPKVIEQIPNSKELSDSKELLLVTGKSFAKNSGIVSKIQELLRDRKIEIYDRVPPEPSTEIVDEGVKFAKSFARVVISLGGGSAIDVGKCISALINEPEFSTVEDYLEGISDKKELSSKGVPFIAIPTTAGTGAEVTKNAVLRSKKLNSKRSFRHEFLFPDVAIIDPLLTLTLPPHLTAQSGMDTLTHLIEGYMTKNSNPFTDTFALEGMKLVIENLIKAYNEPQNYSAREKMSLAALYGGIMISNSGLGLAHGISAVLGGEFNIPHGLANAILLPYVLEFNAIVCAEKFRKIAEVIFEKFFDTKTANVEIANFVIGKIKEIQKGIGIPEKFSQFGIKENNLKSIAEKSLSSSSTRGNPRDVKYEDIVELLQKCI